MGRFISGADRAQATLFPPCVDDWIDEENPVRVVDAFVDGLDLAELVYIPDHDTYRCPAGEALIYRYTNVEAGLTVRRYWTSACPKCPIKANCTPTPKRRITRWEHEHILEAMQHRLDANPNAMRVRRQTVERPFGTLKARMGATHFLMKTKRKSRPRWRFTSSPIT